MQCCTCSKWVYLKCLLLSFSRFSTLGSFHSWSFPLCCVPASSGDSTPTNTSTSSSDSSSWYTSTAQSGPSGFLSANAALPPHPRLQTSYPFSAHLVSFPSAPSSPPYTPGCFSTSLALSGFFNGIVGVSERGALQFNTLFCLISFILFVSRNLILTYLSVSGSLDSVFCDLIAPTAGLVFFFTDITHASGGVIIFVRQGLSFSELSTSSFCLLDPYSDHAEFNISLNNFCSLSFLNVYAPPIRSSPTDSRTDSFSPSIFSSSRNLFILGDFNCHHHLWDTKGTSDPGGEEVLDWVISSDLLPLKDSDIPTLLHCSSGTCSFLDISFAPSSLALFCYWECFRTWVLIIDSTNRPSLSGFLPQRASPAFNFQKACWDDFASYFDTHCSSAKHYSSLSSAAALFTSLTLYAFLTIWYSGLTALFLLVKAALAYLPTALSLALRPLFPFQKVQYVQVFFAEGFAVLGSTNKSATSLLFSFYLTLVLS